MPFFVLFCDMITGKLLQTGKNKEKVKRKWKEKMRIGICDDEEKVRRILAEKVRGLSPEAEVLCYASGEEVLSAGRTPDILFLDIQMPGMGGMEVARRIREKNKRMILIFVTAREDCVFGAFDVGAFHYLVKPFAEQKFASVLLRAIRQYGESVRETGKQGTQEEKCIMILSGGSHIKVCLHEIVYAEVFNRKVVLHTVAGDVEYYGKLSELQKLVGEDFFRPHRSYLVNFRYVVKYDGSEIMLEKGAVPLAKKNYPLFVKNYLEYNRRTWSGEKI